MKMNANYEDGRARTSFTSPLLIQDLVSNVFNIFGSLVTRMNKFHLFVKSLTDFLSSSKVNQVQSTLFLLLTAPVKQIQVVSYR